MAATGRENTPAAVGFLLVTTFALGFFGYRMGGILGGLFGGLVATCVSLLGTAVIRAVRRGDFRESRPVDLSGLDGRQSIAVLNQRASVGAAGGLNLQSEVLDGVAEIESLAERDFASARARARELMEAHPRSPAIPAALSRLFSERDPTRAAEFASRSIRLAIDGGMNRVAVETFMEWPEDAREAIVLPASVWPRLSRALEAREHASAAEWVMAHGRNADDESEDSEDSDSSAAS